MDRITLSNLARICAYALAPSLFLAGSAWGQAPQAARAHYPVKISPTEHTSFLRLGTFEQTRHWAPMSSWTTPAMHDTLSDTLRLFKPHPLPTDGSGQDPLLGSPLDQPFAPIRNTLQWLYDNNIHLTLTDVMVYQYVTPTFDGAAPNSLFNRFDLGMHIKTWDIPDQGTGVFTFLLRANNNLLQTSTAGDAVGAFSPLDDVANNTSFLINRCEFEQTFLNGRLQVTIGKGNPNDVIASNLFAWDENREFMAVTFDGGNYPVGYGGYMPLVSVQAIPFDGMYVSGLVNSGIGSNYQIFSTLGEGLYFCAGEVGAVVELGSDKLQGRYSIALMNSNTGPNTTDRASRTSGNAMAIVAQQQVAPNMAIWSQYLLCSDEIGPAEQEFTIGLSMQECFGRADDGFGIAFGWSKPSSISYPGWRENLQMETYYRLQLTSSWQITPDFQFLPFPSNPNAEKKPVYSFALRLMTTF